MPVVLARVLLVFRHACKRERWSSLHYIVWACSGSQMNNSFWFSSTTDDNSRYKLVPDHRFKNFDTIRLIAAASVIFSHAFLLSDGHEKNEPFVRLTGAIIGIHGVFVFLIISGFLVTHSLQNSNTLLHFAWKRFLRIYPALTVCAIVSAFVIAPFFSDLSIREYLSSFFGAKYVVKVLLLYNNVPEIPTVKFYDQELTGHEMNGSLWTIASEIYCYLILFCLAVLELVSIPIAMVGLFAGSALLALQEYLSVKLPVSVAVTNLFYTVPSFFAGVAMYFIHAKYGLSRTLALGSLVGLLLVAPTGYLLIVSPTLAAYPVIYLGTSSSISLGNAAKFGDLSYGTYLYGWPIEQVVRGVMGPSLLGWGIFLISMPLAALCGWLSWHLVEKHALALKNFRRRKP
jgi:peptidoglycan/LPS O-acetylase OafA/YrhL